MLLAFAAFSSKGFLETILTQSQVVMVLVVSREVCFLDTFPGNFDLLDLGFSAIVSECWKGVV